jgi:hypothetical protein
MPQLLGGWSRLVHALSSQQRSVVANRWLGVGEGSRTRRGVLTIIPRAFGAHEVAQRERAAHRMKIRRHCRSQQDSKGVLSAREVNHKKKEAKKKTKELQELH